ncbi:MULTISPECIES: exo-alpha-sialidase [unclassified Polaromonas]|jgi:predicted neuraminidase|uniref:sialidase family protein n=1 Tax=unclassified Polaromonas TaxID=2638319 RepID=UPI001A27E06A|nr:MULTISPECIES: sialidase family protein [unclassified Polaromonas]MBG6070523.1 putative neuraminidase [Polaromonas sp. CG_9.7]MBG6112521.1 putative neuraminidase [Polaromonas sp. CG_9.2]MDH6184171.1 putative neuraminidase [Polaromonas sp. CG_23.6]
MNLLAALALTVIFLLAGWKIAYRVPADDFLLMPRQELSATKVLPSVQTAAPAVVAPVRQASPDGRFGFNARFVSSSPGRAVHAASLVELRDGRLRAVWFSGSREGARDVVIKTAVMDAAYQQWGEETTLLDRQHLQQGLWRYVKKIGNPVIARMPDDSLMLWMVNVSLGGWAGSSITWLRSTDDGLSWSLPARLVTSPFLNISTLAKGAPIFYQNGQIGLPVYHEFVTKFAEILRISPQGRMLDKTRVPGSQTSLQPVVLVSSAREAQIYMRSGKSTAVMASETVDAGKTWSATHATPWPNPDSALAGVVTASGQQWLALNPKPKNREMLALLQANAAGSFEGAVPWVVESSPAPETPLSVSDYERLLGDELRKQGASQDQTQADIASAKRQLCAATTCLQEFSYPYLLQSRDGYLHLVYTWHRSRIKHVRLDPRQNLQPDMSHHADSAAH